MEIVAQVAAQPQSWGSDCLFPTAGGAGLGKVCLAPELWCARGQWPMEVLSQPGTQISHHTLLHTSSI